MTKNSEVRHKLNALSALNELQRHVNALLDAHDDRTQIFIVTATDEEIDALNALYPERFTNIPEGYDT